MSTLRRVGAVPAVLTDRIGEAMGRLSDHGLLTAALLHAAGSVATAPGTAVQVSIQEMADAPADADSQDGVTRDAQAYLATTTAPAPQARLVVATGPHAGTWTVLGVDRVDAAGAILRLRLTTQRATRAPGVREMLR